MPNTLTTECLTASELERLSRLTCPIPYNEEERIQALRQTELLDSDGDDPMFDRFASLARRLFKVPVAMVTFVDIDRQWFKANIGFEGTVETHRNISFCACEFFCPTNLFLLIQTISYSPFLILILSYLILLLDRYSIT